MKRAKITVVISFLEGSKEAAEFLDVFSTFEKEEDSSMEEDGFLIESSEVEELQ